MRIAATIAMAVNTTKQFPHLFLALLVLSELRYIPLALLCVSQIDKANSTAKYQEHPI
jgi:hypothetical protein